MFGFNHLSSISSCLHLSSSGHHGEAKHSHRHAILDGSRGHTGDRLQLRGRHLVSGNNSYRDGWGEAALRWHTPHEGERVRTVLLCMSGFMKTEGLKETKSVLFTLSVSLWMATLVFCLLNDVSSSRPSSWSPPTHLQHSGTRICGLSPLETLSASVWWKTQKPGRLPHSCYR